MVQISVNEHFNIIEIVYQSHEYMYVLKYWISKRFLVGIGSVMQFTNDVHKLQ